MSRGTGFIRKTVLCNGADVPSDPHSEEEADTLRLHYRPSAEEEGQRIKVNLPQFVQRARHIPDRIRDLLELAAYVFSADRLVSRGSKSAVEYQRWSGRAFNFVVKVRDYEFWNRSEVRELLEKSLEFVSGDRSYSFNFQPGHETPPAGLFDKKEFRIDRGSDTSVSLFSGGLDSLTGAAHRLTTTEENLCLVSHRSQPSIIRTQDRLLEALRQQFPGRLDHYKFKCNLSPKAREETQRTRSFLFGAIAFAIASTFSLDSFYLYENGVTGLNLSPRQSLLNARASRTTHPQTVYHLEELFSRIHEGKFRIQNPFSWKTKTDVIRLLHEEYECGHLHDSAVSCGVTRSRLPVNVTHCGGCSQCVDRRFASYAAGKEDRDSVGIYGTNIVYEGTDSREYQSTFREFMRLAARFRKNGLDTFYRNWINELSEAVEYLRDPDDEDEAVRAIHELHQRHGKQVEKAIQRMRLGEDVYSSPPEGSVLEAVNNREHLGPSLAEKANALLDELDSIEPGREDAGDFEDFVEEAFLFLFEPDLTSPDSQVYSSNGHHISDITFRNDATSGFWHDIKRRYDSQLLVVEAKNKEKLPNEDLNQLTSRLNTSKTLYGVVVCREVSDNDVDRVVSEMARNDLGVLVLTDQDIREMLRIKRKGGAPTEYIAEKHRQLVQKI
jgi:hypothetical protein